MGSLDQRKVISGKEYTKEFKIKMSVINPEDKRELVEAIAFRIEHYLI